MHPPRATSHAARSALSDGGQVAWRVPIAERRQRAACLASVAFLVGIALLAVGGCTSSSDPTSPISSAQGTSAGSPTVAFTTKRARELSRDLKSGDFKHVRDAVALPPGQVVPRRTIIALRHVGTVRFDLRTFHDNGETTATVVGHVGDRNWTVYLVLQGNRWLISGTGVIR
jgi:hypothetical protein